MAFVPFQSGASHVPTVPPLQRKRVRLAEDGCARSGFEAEEAKQKQPEKCGAFADFFAMGEHSASGDEFTHAQPTSLQKDKPVAVHSQSLPEQIPASKKVRVSPYYSSSVSAGAVPSSSSLSASASAPASLLEQEFVASTLEKAKEGMRARFGCAGVSALEVALVVVTVTSRFFHESYDKDCRVFEMPMNFTPGCFLFAVWIAGPNVVVPWGFWNPKTRVEFAPLCSDSMSKSLRQNQQVDLAELEKQVDAIDRQHVGVAVHRKNCMLLKYSQLGSDFKLSSQ